MKTFVFLLLLPVLSFAQPTAEIIKWTDSQVHQTRVESQRADWLAQQLLKAYHFEGDDGVDAILEESDSSWYSGLDLYLAGAVVPLINAMNNDLNATWRDTSIKRATVEIRYDGKNYMVLILSYR